MAYRAIDTATWRDPFFENLRPYAKLLFLHTWTNDVCTPSGLYEVSKKRMEFEVGFEIDDVVEELAPKIEINLNKNIVWVKNFFRRQCASPQFATAAVKAIKLIDVEYKNKFLEYNHDILIKFKVNFERFGLDTPTIPPRYPHDTMPPTGSGSGSGSDTGSGSEERLKRTPLRDACLDKKTRIFEKRVGNHLEPILERCKAILSLAQKNGKKFNPYQFVQSAVNDSIHPAAIVDALDGIKKQWAAVSNPWTYGQKILKVNSGNYCEREHTAECEKFKTAWDCNEEILKLTRGIGEI